MGLEILMATMHKKNISDIDWEYKQTNADILLINQADFDNSEVAGNIRMLSCKERGSSIAAIWH